MSIRITCLAIALLVIGFSMGSTRLHAQDSPALTSGEDAYQAQRKFANTLLEQDKYLEALPVFESLAKQNSNDPDVIFGWGLSLMNHSATLTDTEAARQERVRARELLIRSKELGKKSGLLDNLLDMLPLDGAVTFSSVGDVDAAMKAGEAAFAKNDYEEAIKNYTHAAQLDPKNYHALLFIGDSYFAERKFPEAVQWYDRAISLDPNIETGYRYEADLYIKSGEMEKARQRSIQAVVADPYTQATWRALNYWANSNKVALSQRKISVPGSTERKDEMHINITLDPKDSDGTSGAWAAYQLSRAAWMGDEFKKHFPNEKQYRHSLLEEADALRLAAAVLTGKDNMKKHGKDYQKNPDVSLLLRLCEAKMIEPYVLLSAPDRDIALNDYAPYRSQHRDQLEAYLSQFVVPPTPPQTGKN
jgi:tetratricopeptide (TPR) repeat protein